MFMLSTKTDSRLADLCFMGGERGSFCFAMLLLVSIIDAHWRPRQFMNQFGIVIR